MIFAHKIRLKPTTQQAVYFKKACGVRRKAYNWALDEWKRLYAAGEKPSAFSLSKQFNDIKAKEFPYVSEVTKCASANAILDLGKAFTNFFAGRAKYPKHKKKFVHDSFRINNDQFSTTGKSVKIPKLGNVKMRESLRFCGRILSATVSRQADYWFISITVDTELTPATVNNQDVVGVDLGIKCFAQLSVTEAASYYSPKPLRNNLKKLKRLQRSVSRKVRGSSNRRKAVRKLAKLHYRITCKRKEFLHQLTTWLSKNFGIISIEDLSVKWMLANRHLSRAVSDLGFYEFRRQLEYKQLVYGTYVHVVSRFYPSTKTCSNCGCIHKHIKLKDRTYICPECGLVIDRDYNAALNLERAACVNLQLPKVLREAKPVDRADPNYDSEQSDNGWHGMKQELITCAQLRTN